MKKLIANDYNVLDVLKENPNGGYFGKHKDGNKPKIRLIYTDNSYLIKEKCALLLIRMSKHYFNQLTDWFDDVIKRNFFSVAHLLRKETLSSASSSQILFMMSTIVSCSRRILLTMKSMSIVALFSMPRTEDRNSPPLSTNFSE